MIPAYRTESMDISTRIHYQCNSGNEMIFPYVYENLICSFTLAK